MELELQAEYFILGGLLLARELSLGARVCITKPLAFAQLVPVDTLEEEGVHSKDIEADKKKGRTAY